MKKFPISLLTVTIIIILSLAPIGAPEVARDVPFADKWTHMVMYGGLALVIGVEMWRSRQAYSMATRMALVMLLPALLGALMELCQTYLTTYRSGEWLDVAANTTGTLLGSLPTLIRKDPKKP